MTETIPNRRWIGYTLAWLIAAGLAVTVGVLAVTSAGAGVRGRGPLGSNEMIRNAELTEGSATPAASASSITKEITDEFGTFVVECRGATAIALEARPDQTAGWRTVSFEPGPDDDVDAVFANGDRSIEVEVFCNRGVPTLAELEHKTLSGEREDDDD